MFCVSWIWYFLLPLTMKSKEVEPISLDRYERPDKLYYLFFFFFPVDENNKRNGHITTKKRKSNPLVTDQKPCYGAIPARTMYYFNLLRGILSWYISITTTRGRIKVTSQVIHSKINVPTWKSRPNIKYH